jgi:hypothetical protein
MAVTRSLLYILLGVVVGAAVALVGAYFFAKGASGQVILRDFLVGQSKPVVETQAVVTKPTSSAASSTAPTVLLVPKTYATQDYFLAINNVLQDLYAINTTNTQLGPLLETLNRQTLSCSYIGFYEAMGQAHQLANKNQTLVSQLSFHLTALAAANTQTKDAVTKANTQALVAAGTSFLTALQGYASAANGLLAGDTPTSAQIADFQSKVNSVAGSSQAFATALKPLLSHIVDADKAVASSTPVKK